MVDKKKYSTDNIRTMEKSASSLALMCSKSQSPCS